MTKFRDNPKLARYVDELWEWNKKFSLTGAKDKETIWAHIADSLYLEEFIRADNVSVVADIGSGQGLPVVPLALAVPEKRYIAAEVNDRKIAFLDWIAASLGLPIETLKVVPKTSIREECIVICKAFASITDIVTWQKAHAPEAARFYLLKGEGDNTRRELEEAASKHPGLRDELLGAKVTEFDKGCVVTIEKEKGR
ncbi:MAG: hypothetical protein A2Y33_09790 [Spirochaetes bacterium GWF1_51_8]|nr:MAG: hypothetical protein A2Y33_09790 [Spirochaetes bacterium GWF1_51_8]